MAAVTRLWPYGGPGHPYGSFAGKAEQIPEPEPEVTPVPTGGGRIYPYPVDRPKRRKIIPQPLPEYEVSGPLSRDRQIEHAKLPDWDQEAWEASLRTLQYLETEREMARKVIRKKRTEQALIMWLLH